MNGPNMQNIPVPRTPAQEQFSRELRRAAKTHSFKRPDFIEFERKFIVASKAGLSDANRLDLDNRADVKQRSLDTINWAIEEAKKDGPNRAIAEYVEYMWTEIEMIRREGVWTDAEILERVRNIIH